MGGFSIKSDLKIIVPLDDAETERRLRAYPGALDFPHKRLEPR